LTGRRDGCTEVKPRSLQHGKNSRFIWERSDGAGEAEEPVEHPEIRHELVRRAWVDQTLLREEMSDALPQTGPLPVIAGSNGIDRREPSS
jgi:hypothetical protein